ncbi:hypothetical protein ASC84_12295 [Acinetobacter sp. Root1280]|uniref:hypothetical protein n=1 Tax=Acinetobacter sp. Root1280 TaxID=1736444 RepID=UPI0006F5ACB6|nr:hypothetical protein [Acinetobacter sp. Root1280]KQW88153.1 hypothetical protein ASC84_12295 [Acinetobacter sp. Root1280]
MKKILILSAILPSLCFADTKQLDNDIHECGTIFKTAEMVIQAKQQGVSITKQIEANDLALKKSNDQATYKEIDTIIKEAYSKPISSSDSEKEAELSSFPLKHYMAC